MGEALSTFSSSSSISNMFTTPIHLNTRRPSPTTVSYTASNAPPRNTITAHVSFFLALLFRVYVGIFALLVVITKSQCRTPAPDHLPSEYECSIWLPLQSPMVNHIAFQNSWQVLIPVSLVIYFLVFRRFHTGIASRLLSLQLLSLFHPLLSRKLKLACLNPNPFTEESLLVLRTLGIQTSTTSSTYLSSSTTRFIPTSLIQDIFIHEAFKGFEVRYYLAVVVEGEGEVVVVFPVSGLSLSLQLT